MRRVFATVLILLPFLVSTAQAQFVDHAGRAKRVRDRYGLDEKISNRGLKAVPFLDEHFIKIPTGAYDLYVSHIGLGQDDEIERTLKIAESLLDGMGVWLDWLPPEKAERKSLEKDLAVAKKWLKRFKPKTLARALKDGQRGDALVMFKAKDSVREAFQRLTAYFATGKMVGLEKQTKAIPIVLCTTRGEFLEMLSFAGWAEPTQEKVFWAQGTEAWTHFYMEDVRFYSLRHPGGGSLDSEKVENGTQQQVLQLATGALIEAWYGERMAIAMTAGISLNLVVEVFGQCNTRIDGDLRARKTEAFEVFVPGGLSEGGVLPAMPADTRWREFQAAHHFIAHLSRAQKDGTDDMRRKGGGKTHFRLLGDNQGQKMVVSAPFLGSSAVVRDKPGTVFKPDWLEFVRAYRACFLHWLRTEGAGSEKESAAAYARLLRGLSAAKTVDQIEAVWATVYEVEALSSPEVGKDTLEGAFLIWLSKQK
jgi:hypothetical protein